jgi:hypothetical protein
MSGTVLRLPSLTPQQAAEVLEREGFSSCLLYGDDERYAAHLVAVLARPGQDPMTTESIAYAVARITGIDTANPAVCAGCRQFTDAAFLTDGCCPDCTVGTRARTVFSATWNGKTRTRKSWHPYTHASVVQWADGSESIYSFHTSEALARKGELTGTQKVRGARVIAVVPAVRQE